MRRGRTRAASVAKPHQQVLNKNKGGNGDTGRSKRQQGHKPSSSARQQQQQPQREPQQQAEAQQGDIVLVDLDEEEASDANMADESDQGGGWLPAQQTGKRWRRQTRTHRLTSSSEGGNLDKCAEHETDEADSHPATASKASQRDSGDKSTGTGPGEPQGDAGRGR